MEPINPPTPLTPPQTQHLTSDRSTGEKQPEKLDLNRPCRIKSVNFEGATRTRPSLLAKIVSNVFESKTLIDFLQRSVEIKANLVTLNAFSSVDILLDSISEKDDENYQVTFVLKERSRVTASAQTAVDNHSSHVDLQLALPNLNGVGDSLQFNSKFNKKFYSGECRYSIPLTPWRNLWATNYSLSYSQYQWENLPSGYDQEDKSIINQLDFFSLPQLQHNVTFENIWRFIKSSSVKTPIAIREQAGHSIKSSLKHNMTWDNRLGRNFFFGGALAKLSNECTLNLVNGSAKFTRHELNLQYNATILPRYDLLCQVNLLAGTLLRRQKVSICDRFFAGGPLTVRGFKFQGLGSNVDGYPLGDTSYLSVGAHLYSILPYTTPESSINEFIRPHLFFNTGTIGDVFDMLRLSSTGDIRREVKRFKDSLRHTCGFGLVFYFMKLRLEVNYCIPLIFKQNDMTSPGVNWGFGLIYT